MKISKSKIDKVATHPFQSFSWGEFRKALGNEVIRTRYGQIILYKIPKTRYKIGLFVKGPEPTQKMLDYLKSIAKKSNLIFIKLEPNLAVSRRHTVDGKENKSAINNQKSIILLKNNGCVKGKEFFTKETFVIDLSKNEEELLKSFKSKTRYNIRLAQRHGVSVQENNSDKAFEGYLALARETVERQGYYAHTEKYHRQMWKILSEKRRSKNEKPIAHLLNAYYRKEIITAWILFVWKDTLYYPYGASTQKHKDVQANSLMMWEAIRFGKRLGLTKFDLWGKIPGKGFTRFKEGFNPEVVEFVGTWDLVTSKLYWPYRILDQIRWVILKAKAKFTKPSF